jgi:hypothetical protein
LGERMNAGIRPTRPMYRDGTSRKWGERLFQQTLNGCAGCLSLPANVIRTVVLNRQLEIAH